MARVTAFKPRALVVGGGIVGAACAREFARRGFAARVLEAAEPAAGATGAGMGHVVVMDGSPAQFALTAYSARLWAEAAPELGEACAYDPCGTLWVGDDAAAVRAKAVAYAGVGGRLVEPRDLEPNLRSGLAGGLFVPGDAVLDPAATTLRLLAEPGVELERDRRVLGLGRGYVDLAERRLEADVIVVATGARAGELCGLPVRPRKGQLALTAPAPGFIRRQILELGYVKRAELAGGEASVAFNVQPKPGGRVLIGASRADAGWREEIDRPLLDRMLQVAYGYLPGLAGLAIERVWHGFRPASFDGVPFIGPLPDAPGVYAAVGHEGLGIATSLATAAILADLAEGKTPAIDASPFDPRRLLAPPAGEGR